MYLFIYFYTGPILIAVFRTEMVIMFKRVIVIIIIIIIIIIIKIKSKSFIDNKVNYKILFTINFT